MPGEEMTPEELAALAREMEERVFDERIIAELERVPDLSAVVPADFAARVAAKVPAKRAVSVSVRQTHYGWTVMWCCFAVLLAAMVIVATRGLGHSAIGTAVEWTLCAQFLALAIWFVMRGWKAG